MNKIKQLIVAGALLLSGLAVFATPQSALAVNAIEQACGSSSSSTLCAGGASSEKVDSFLKVLINTLLFIVGLISVIMIITGGIFYTISAGDSAKVTRAKNTIMYAVVGLVIAFLAYSIVNWVLKIV